MAVQFYEETVTVNGREYTLQHPGVPEWQKRRQEMAVVKSNGNMMLDILSLLEYSFEHVVIPKKGAKLKLTNWSPKDQGVLEEVWQPLLLNFLRGKDIARNHASANWRENHSEEWRDLEKANLSNESGSGPEEEPQESSGGREKESSHKDADRRDRQGGHQQRTSVSDRGD